MADLLAALADPPSGRAGAIWFDSLAYSRAKLLSGAPVPWDSPGDLTAFFGKAQGMFRSDALLVDLADLQAWRGGNDDELRAAIPARARPGYALRTLLADEHARAVAREAVTALAATAGAVPVVLSIPSPARWLAVAAEQAGQDAGPPDPDRAETGAMCISPTSCGPSPAGASTACSWTRARRPKTAWSTRRRTARSSTSPTTTSGPCWSVPTPHRCGRTATSPVSPSGSRRPPGTSPPTPGGSWQARSSGMAPTRKP